MIQSHPPAFVLFEESAYLGTTQKPMYSYDKVIGGIGVRGLSEEEDAHIAYPAIRKIYG